MMTKLDFLLIALAAGEKSEHTPVQIQKLMFLVERNVSNRIGGQFFEFSPYDYGPFDSSIYKAYPEMKANSVFMGS